MRELGIVEDALFWRDEDGTVYPALSKCCQGLLVDPMIVTARCSECARPFDTRSFGDQGTLFHFYDRGPHPSERFAC